MLVLLFAGLFTLGLTGQICIWSAGNGFSSAFQVAIFSLAQPFCVIFFRQYDWHSGMDLSDKLVRFTGDDRTGAQPFVSGGVFPAFPKAGKDERRTVLHADCVWDLPANHLLPLVKGVYRDEASSLLECMTVLGAVSTLSARALMVLYAILGSFAQYDSDGHCARAFASLVRNALARAFGQP
jgi:hypothetical protein